MSTDGGFPQAPPPEAVTTRTEHQAAVSHWLLAGARSASEAHTGWEESGTAWLCPDQLFTAVIVPADVVHAALGRSTPRACAAPLASTLVGPVFYSPEGFGPQGAYTVLLPPHTGEAWDVPGAVVHPASALLLVPDPGKCEPTEGPWWVVPLASPDQLGSLYLLTALVVMGRDRLGRSGGGPHV
ncbi:hypothetical protein ABZ543_07960 [Streptomyces roseifaciens]